MFCVVGLLLSNTSSAQNASPASTETFTLSGTVVNSVTGEPIPRALVRTNGVIQRTLFTDGEGHFQFDGLPAVRASVIAQKPGYYAPREGPGPSSSWFEIGPNMDALTLKLAPMSAIYGRITDAAGQPIEHVPVRLTLRSLRDGRKSWEQRGMSESDENGHFRFPSLIQGTYYVAAGPETEESPLLAAGEKAKTGFAHVYYPGVPDLTSALPIQLSPGQQAEADFSLSAVPVYEVSGTIAGRTPDQGVGFQLLTQSGDDISLPTNFNMENGIFKLDAVPAGSYIVRAISQTGGQPMRGEARVNVSSNVEDLRLTLAPAVSIPITVRMDSHNSSTTRSLNPDRPPISVRLLPGNPNAAESFSSIEPVSPGHSALALRNLDPGTYTVLFTPQPPWYVQSASYGQINALSDDISVSPGQSYSLDIVLRDDSASLSGTVKSSDANPTSAAIVIVPQPAGKMSPHVLRGRNEFAVSGLAPGDYLVFAFDTIDDLEYTNPDALAAYASQAAHVTLTPNQQAQVSLDLIHVTKAE